MKTIMKYYEKSKPFFKGLLYLLFILIYINMIMGTTNVAMIIIYTIVMVLVLAGNILYDYLKHLYQKLQIAFTIDCDYPKAAYYRQRIIKFDFFKGMKDSLRLSDLLISLDQNQPDETLKLIAEKPSFFTSQLDMIYIRNHSTFKAYALLNNRTQAIKAYNELNKLRDVSTRKNNKQISALYDWHQIDGLYYYISKNARKSLAAYNQCNTQNMNNRELTHYYYERSLVHKTLQQTNEFNQCQEAIRAINPTSPFLVSEDRS